MRDEKAFEQALIDLQGATNYRGLRVNLVPHRPNAQAFLAAIHYISMGIPIDTVNTTDNDGHTVMPTGTPEQYASVADNIILLAKAMKASIRGLK